MAGESRGRAKKDKDELSARSLRRRREEFAPKPEGKPIKPKWFTQKTEAGKYWAKYVPLLVESGLATAVDTPELVALCEWWEDYRRCRSIDDQLGASRAYAAYSKVSARFGMTPLDRHKIQASSPTKEEEDPFKMFLKKRLGGDG